MQRWYADAALWVAVYAVLGLGARRVIRSIERNLWRDNR